MSGQEQGDFEFQLQAEQLAAESGTGGAWDKIRTYTDPNDGTVYEWDNEKRGWFPKVSSHQNFKHSLPSLQIDETFLAAYQANYGVVEPEATPPDPALSIPAVTSSTKQPASDEKPAAGSAEDSESTRKRKHEGVQCFSLFLFVLYTSPSLPPLPPSLSLSESGWFEVEDSKNHNIYVSGLPHDITLEEFEQLMSKYGIIMEDDDGGCDLFHASIMTHTHTCTCTHIYIHTHTYIKYTHIHTHRGT